MFEVTTLHIILRLVLIILISGIIGYDREHKSRPAGIRTTMLVGVGACIIAMTQQEIAYQAIQFTIAHRNLGNVVRTDQARLICQVVSGIGFLGAGTIIVHRGDISGLTTAASLWVTAGLGIVVGMGYYEIAVISSLVVICVLMFVKRIIHVNVLLKLEVQYLNKKEALAVTDQYFDDHGIKIRKVKLSSKIIAERLQFTSYFELSLPKQMTLAQVENDLAHKQEIIAVRRIEV